MNYLWIYREYILGDLFIDNKNGDKYHKVSNFLTEEEGNFRDISVPLTLIINRSTILWHVDRGTYPLIHQHTGPRHHLPPLLPHGRRYPRGSSIYRAVTIYTVSKMPAFGILVIRTSERGGATAVKEWNTIRSTSRARVLHSRSEAPGPGVAGIMNETVQSRFSVRAPGQLRVCEREGSVEALQEELNGTERKKFRVVIFRWHNKNASPHPRHRRRRHFDLLCAQVAASQAVTHPAGFLRIEKGATMEDARRPERRWLVSSWKTTHARTAIYAISFEGATRGPSPVNNATLRGGAESLARLSMDVNDQRPRAFGRDRPRNVHKILSGSIVPSDFFFISHFSLSLTKVDGSSLKSLDIEVLEFLRVVKSSDS